MFYSQFILAKKGPLGTIWIAAHLERKLRKNQVADTDIGVSVDSILSPDVPIALRLSSHLLLGVVRIYSRKVNYLFDDCSEALLKVKQAFRSTAVDLPPEQSKAPYHSITLPETFDLDDFELPDNEILQGNFVDHHVSSKEQITLQDTMDGVTFSTLQFGPDERFGDGDASQIGLDLDEDLFLDKGEAAETSGFCNDTDTEHQASTKNAELFEDNEQNEEVSDLPLASPKKCCSIQAPSTPGLMEGPNFPCAQEALISDDHVDDNPPELATKELSGNDHVDEDQNPPELATKELSGNIFGQEEPSDIHSLAFHSNGKCHFMSEQENEKPKLEGAILSNEASELTLSGDVQTPKFDEYVGAENGIYSSGDKAGCLLQNERVVTDIQFKGDSDHADVGINGVDISWAKNGILPENNDRVLCDAGGKADVNGTYIPISDNGAENISAPNSHVIVGTEETEGMMVSSGSECQYAGHPCQNTIDAGIFKSNDKKLSAFSGPMLQPCNASLTTHVGEENLADAANLRAEDDILGTRERDNASSVSGISTDIDVTQPTLNGDQIACQVTSKDDSNSGRLDDSVNTGEDQRQKEYNTKLSEFSAPEKLLSVPNPPIGQSDNVLVEFTPGKDFQLEDADANGEKLMSGRKRSYTESNLTIQSLNSADSSGAAQSKQSTELIPDDDDLLSSILAGKRSTSIKMKPTPPPDSVSTKRQLTSTRNSAPKRKVLVDDSMVLHGDTIRQQLINTEDIRRVRKKAPCTRLEVWVFQKQLLGDEVFSEPIFTGMSPASRSSHSEAFDRSGIRFFQGNGSKGASDVDISTRPTLEAGTVETSVPSAAEDVGRQEHIDGLNGTSVDGSILQKELETFDNEVAKQMSQYDVSGNKIQTENGNGGAQARGVAESSVAELTTPVSPVSVATRDLTHSNTVDEPNVDKISEVNVPMDIDASCPYDQGNCLEYTKEASSVARDVSSSDRRDEESADFDIQEKVESDEKANGDLILERMEGADVNETVAVDLHDTSSLPVCDVTVNDSVSLEGRASPTSEKIMEEPHLGERGCDNKAEIYSSDVGQSVSSLASNILLGEDVKLDTPAMVDVDLNSQETGLNDTENLECWQASPKIIMHSTTLEVNLNSQDTAFNGTDNLEFWQASPMIVMDSTPSPTEFTRSTDHTDVGREGIEHDTDFLNVDDDEADEDYDSDLHDDEEKRILDNSGWSSRTRAVANYIQVLFEKDANQSKKVISLENLLAGKSRKEASRMFFETLVLKTKDYIHAEQEGSFSDIKIKPMGKLLKS